MNIENPPPRAPLLADVKAKVAQLASVGITTDQIHQVTHWLLYFYCYIVIIVFL